MHRILIASLYLASAKKNARRRFVGLRIVGDNLVAKLPPIPIPGRAIIKFRTEDRECRGKKRRTENGLHARHHHHHHHHHRSSLVNFTGGSLKSRKSVSRADAILERTRGSRNKDLSIGCTDIGEKRGETRRYNKLASDLTTSP